jgi:hypothetical protein
MCTSPQPCSLSYSALQPGTRARERHMAIHSAVPELPHTLPNRPVRPPTQTARPPPTLILGHHPLASPRPTPRLTAALMTLRPQAKIFTLPPPLPMPIQPPHQQPQIPPPSSRDLLLMRQRPLVVSRKPRLLGVEMRALDTRKAHLRFYSLNLS